MPRIAELALFTEDVAGLTEFYEHLLGRRPESRSVDHASFDLEGAKLFIHASGGEGSQGAPNADHFAFALDLDEAADRARVAGAAVDGPREFYWGRSAYLRDPDGRAVELTSEAG